jgi:hypothetical protein
VLEYSLREALQLGHNYIGTEHILLGLVREGEGVAAQVLVLHGAELSQVRHRVIELLSGSSGPGAEQVGSVFDEPMLAGFEADAGWFSARGRLGGLPSSWSAQLLAAVGVFSILHVLIGLLAVAVDRPAAALVQVALVGLIACVVATMAAVWAQLLDRDHDPRLRPVLGRWLVLASVSLTGTASVLLLLDAVLA